MALVALDLDEAHIRRDLIERAGDHPRFGGREQPVGAEGDEQEPRPRAPEGGGERAAVIRRKIEEIHRPCDREIGIRVEAADEGRALMGEIALHLEALAEQHGLDRPSTLQPAAEFPRQRGFGEIGDMRRHPGHGEAARGNRPMRPVAAIVELRIGEDRLAADLVEGDVLRRVIGRRRHRHRGEDRIRIHRRPGQNLHAAHRAADHREKPLDSEMLDEFLLRPDHVADRHRREIEAPEFARFVLVRAARPGRAHAAAEHIGADDEIAVGIDRLAGPHHGLPPAGLAGQRMRLGDILIAGQRMADQDRVGPVRVQPSVGAIGDLDLAQRDAAVEREPVVEPDGLVDDFGKRHDAHEPGYARNGPARQGLALAVSAPFCIRG